MSLEALFPPHRQAGLDRLQAFLPSAGRAYARDRNHDSGPGLKTGVSMLSPYLRHRLLTEAEVIQAVLGQHRAEAAEKYLQEVCWRSYWKGWLQLRPAVWQDYLEQLDADRQHCSGEHAATLAAATAGQTGIACFDDWAQELVNTGYLHNHARMWLASIWIFTLKLPWTLGADWFLRHLIDGDAASNTLSWRWVAGIQTEGKTYLARADNIEQYTQGRYRPTGLATAAPALPPRPKPAPSPLPTLSVPPTDRPSLLLIHSEDFSAAELFNAASVAEAWVISDGLVQQWPYSESGLAFCRGAADDVAQRLAPRWPVQVSQHLDTEALVARCQALGIQDVVTTEPPVGPLADDMAALHQALSEKDVALHMVRRDWDQHAWPHAIKGFFAFKKQIPALIADLG
jgi:deoxyribodipyrimidine photo-lyase